MGNIGPNARTRANCYGRGRRVLPKATVRCDHAARRLVGAARTRVRWPQRLPDLLHLGSVPGGTLLLGALPLAVLLAGTFRLIAAQSVWAEARRVARLG